MKKWLKAALILAASALGCWLLFFLADEVFNGILAEWFTNYFVQGEYRYLPVSGESFYSQTLDWPRIRLWAMVVFVGNLFFWLTVLLIVCNRRERKAAEKTITGTAGMIRASMEEAGDLAAVFPRGYEEIAVQMGAIRQKMLVKEQTLQAESARKNDLITYLAHDLKTPLTSVIGYLSLLAESPELSAEQRAKYVGIALDKALRLEKLINEFFDITRYNLQQVGLEKKPVELSYMLVQMTDEFYPVLQKHGNRIQLAGEEEMVVPADADQLARVFNNLLKNAVAYSEPGSVIQVRVERLPRKARISFSNQGKTIPKQKLDSIFEKFFRLDEARASDTGGAGLGLAIAREIVTLHGGEIFAQSEDGTTVFTVELPL